LNKKATVNENNKTVLLTNSLKATQSSTSITSPTSEISHKIINKHHFTHGIRNVLQNHQQASFHQLLKMSHPEGAVGSMKLDAFSASVCH
jgi:hypothetical protein